MAEALRVIAETFDGVRVHRNFSAMSAQDSPVVDSVTMGYWVDRQLETISGFPIVVNPLNLALNPLYLTQEEADELDDFLARPQAFPTIPVREVPRGDRSRLVRHNH